MSPPAGGPRRSGDPRKRAAESSSPAPSSGPTRAGRPQWAVVAALVVGSAVVSLAVLALGGDDPAPASSPRNDGPAVDARALPHVEAACDLTTKARQAADAPEIDERTRYAAAVLLLDRAIIEAERAAATDTAMAELDTAVQAVHTAGHDRDPAAWDAALTTALAECDAVLG